MTETATAREIALEAKRCLAEAFGSRLKGVVLHGSEARGEATEDSDIDLLVLLEGPVSTFKDIGTIVDATYHLELETGRMIDGQPADVQEYEEGAVYLYRLALREGVPL
jgi:predicted nucleotidyltransferase